jgi:hypothetical protein
VAAAACGSESGWTLHRRLDRDRGLQSKLEIQYDTDASA